MSSVDNEPRLLDTVVQECLRPVLRSNPGQDREEVPLSAIGEEAFFRQSGSIPARIAELVEAQSDKRFTVRPVDGIVVSGVSLSMDGGVYFARCSADTASDGVLTTLTDDMVIFEINRYRKVLTIGVATHAQDVIDQKLLERTASHERQREDERLQSENARVRNEETRAEHLRIVDSIEWHLETTGSQQARDKWDRMCRPYSQHYGTITLPELLELCHMLGIDLATLATPLPATAAVSH